MIGIPIGLLYVNAAEWTIHKYMLHGFGAKKNSFWSFHWSEHHRDSRQNNYVDDAYTRSLFSWGSQSKEALGLVIAAAVHVPLFPIAPFFTGAVWYGIANYYRVHKRSHLDPEWAKIHLPWHYDHHMGPNQNTNWCITRPWFDNLMGTREPYLGTQKEKEDLERRASRQSKP